MPWGAPARRFLSGAPCGLLLAAAGRPEIAHPEARGEAAISERFLETGIYVTDSIWYQDCFKIRVRRQEPCDP